MAVLARVGSVEPSICPAKTGRAPRMRHADSASAVPDRCRLCVGLSLDAAFASGEVDHGDSARELYHQMAGAVAPADARQGSDAA